MNVRYSSHGFELTSELEKYANNKVVSITKQIPRKLRAGASCQLHFTQTHNADNKFNTCSITLTLAGVELKAKETTLHMYAALDVAAVHMEQQLKDHVARSRKHRLRSRLKRSSRSD